MTIEIREIAPDELMAWQRVMIRVFGEDAKDEELERFGARMELDRSLGAYDGATIVGTGALWTYEMQVPGGAFVPTPGVTGVTVLPTHRRRMILTRMMERQLNQVAERGEPLAALWASESAIYGRFGYGVAIEGSDLELERAHSGLRSEGPESGTVRLIDEDDARATIPGIYEAAVAGIPGAVRRTEEDWELFFYDPENWRDGASAVRFAVYEDDGEARGFVRYRQKATWRDSLPDHRLLVTRLHAVDAEAYAALHRFAFGIDLVSTIELYTRRVEEPLLDLLVDRRRVKRRLADKIWLRIVDVPAALAARRYAVEGDLVIRVVDDFGPWADGTYRLTGGPDGAECAPTTDEPDLVISVADLSAAYLGDSRLPQAAWLGRIDGDPAAVLLAHRMFSWHVEPWCTVNF